MIINRTNFNSILYFISEKINFIQMGLLSDMGPVLSYEEG